MKRTWTIIGVSDVPRSFQVPTGRRATDALGKCSKFQVLTPSGPAAATGGRGWSQRHRPRGARDWKPEHLEICDGDRLSGS